MLALLSLVGETGKIGAAPLGSPVSCAAAPDTPMRNSQRDRKAHACLEDFGCSLCDALWFATRAPRIRTHVSGENDCAKVCAMWMLESLRGPNAAKISGLMLELPSVVSVPLVE